MKKHHLFTVLIVFAIVSTISSCIKKVSTSGPTQTKTTYFDLAGYIDQEITRLSNSNTTINKFVAINGETEQKKVIIENWANELAAFKEADINKPSWVGSYSVDSTAQKIIYSSLDPSLKTKKITILLNENGDILSLEIENQIENWIYTAQEKLFYAPDSLYEIVKDQNIRLVGHNTYKIKGQF